MKIEVIEKKREEAKETPFVVGGVYATDGRYNVLAKDWKGNYAMINLAVTAEGDRFEPGTIDWNFVDEAMMRDAIHRNYRHVPNARLVIDENEGEASV